MGKFWWYMDKNKLEILKRKQKAKNLFSDFANDVKRCLKKKPNDDILLNLTATLSLIENIDKTVEECVNQITPCFKDICEESEIGRIYAVIERLKDAVSENQLFLIRPLSEYCGAIITGVNTLCEFRDCVSLNQDDFILVSAEAQNGVIISYDTDKYLTGDKNTYNLLVWGESWLNVINSNH